MNELKNNVRYNMAHIYKLTGTSDAIASVTCRACTAK